MATAHIESPTGTLTPLNAYNYACPASADGMHNWNGVENWICYCVPGGTVHTFCVECGESSDEY